MSEREVAARCRSRGPRGFSQPPPDVAGPSIRRERRRRRLRRRGGSRGAACRRRPGQPGRVAAGGARSTSQPDLERLVYIVVQQGRRTLREKDDRAAAVMYDAHGRCLLPKVPLQTFDDVDVIGIDEAHGVGRVEDHGRIGAKSLGRRSTRVNPRTTRCRRPKSPARREPRKVSDTMRIVSGKWV